MTSQPTWPFRVPLAREQLRRHLVRIAGVDPDSGYWLGDDPAHYKDQTADERKERYEYLQRLDQSVSYLAGFIESNSIRVWRDRDGSLELASPVNAAQHFFECDGHTDLYYFDKVEWEQVFSNSFPQEPVSEFGANKGLLEGENHETAKPSKSETAPIAWSEMEMLAAIKECGFSNREDAWNDHFRSLRDVHRWDIEAFRKVWSTGRGTKGQKGRPLKTE